MKGLIVGLLLMASFRSLGQSNMWFDLVFPDHSGVEFANDLLEDEVMNVLTYEYFYNGGGVAIGDINNDGLPDIYLTGNMIRDRLFLNEGNMRFRDITDSAGIDTEFGWKFGVTIADVNGDGLLDIYVCRAGAFPGEMRANRMYINNGDLTFTDRAGEMGLADTGHSIHAAFFDYDRDGDLDLYVINTPMPFASEIRIPFWQPRSPQRCDVLYRNNGSGTFTDVTVQAGLPPIEYGYGLGVTIGDLNRDGWDDIYVANDYSGPDYMYINNGNGTFTNAAGVFLGHTSNTSMGGAISDLNNDGWPEIIVLDMMAEDYKRSKWMMASMDVAEFWRIYSHGGHFQYMSNTLQLNNRNGSFSEIGQFAGIAKTDWSWAVLPADFDNDGHKDLFVTNGIYRDITDRDFAANQEALLEQAGEGRQLPIGQVLNLFESTELSNYAFRNNGDLTFTNRAVQWGLNLEGFSQGVAYGDLDGDGALDLVINNLNFPALVYRNEGGGNYLRLKLEGEGMNRFAVGAKVELFTPAGMQYQEQQTTSGYLSGSEPVIHFGLGDELQIDSVRVWWPLGTVTVINKPAANQVITALQSSGVKRDRITEQKATPFADITRMDVAPFVHRENAYNDFEKEVLLPHSMSQFGPALAVGDVNGDGLEDIYIGGAAGQPGAMLLQTSAGVFTPHPGPWEAARAFEDVAAILFDADNDGDLDLYVVSGGNEFPQKSPLLQDRLYINNGTGNFVRDVSAVPEMLTSGGSVVAGDFNRDGWVDLFVGGRVKPGEYPWPAKSHLLMNEQGKFRDVTSQVCPELVEPGMITDAQWVDINKDGWDDLVVCGEWMPVKVFMNTKGKLTEARGNGLDASKGWWWSLHVADVDGDGDMDIIAGNLGRNAKFSASQQKPFHVFSMDFDGNGTNDIVLSKYYNNQLVPVRGRECSSQQMPFIAQKFPTYRSFSEAYLHDIFPSSQLEQALHLTATEFSTGIFINDGKGSFTFQPLPNEAQLAPVMAIQMADINEDGQDDIIIAGNLWPAEVETVRYDAGTGLVLLNEGQGRFTPMHLTESGLYAQRDVRDMKFIRRANGEKLLLVANNNDFMQVFRFKQIQGR